MKNTTTIAIAMALAVTAVPSMIWYYQLPDEPAPTPPPEPETSDPVMTEEHKQGLLSLGAVSFLKDIDEAKSYDLLSEAQVDEMKTAVWALGYESMPEDLMQALAAVDDGGEPYVTYYNQSSPLSAAIKFSAAFYEITDIFKDYLSPELNTFVTMIGGDKGCIGKFDRSDIKEEYTSRVHGHESGGDIRDEDDIRSVQMHMPDGAWNMKCENGADVNLLVYPSGEEEDVRVSYDFENVVAYFEKNRGLRAGKLRKRK